MAGTRGWTKRRMQFEAGPQTMTFYACARAECAAALAAGCVLCFMGIRGEPAAPVTDEEVAARGEHCSQCGAD